MIKKVPRVPLVDIVIPVYGSPDLVRRTIVNVLLNTYVPCVLWLVDDKPGDKEQAELFEQLAEAPNPRVHLVRNEHNMGFGSSNNKAAALGKALFILFLNSDTVPTPGYLSTMLFNMFDPKVGIVGAKLLFAEGSPHGPFGTVQHCGVFRTKHGEPFHAYEKANPYDERANCRLELDCITGACLLVRRALFEDLEGFDPVFRVGTFEDVNLCWEARKVGWKVVYDPNAVVYHHFAGSGKEATHRHSVANKAILMERWGNLGSDMSMLR